MAHHGGERRAFHHRSTRWRVSRPIGLALAGSVVLAASSGWAGTTTAGASGSKKPIVFGSVAAETGAFGPYGIGIVQGMKAEIAIINSKGGVLGRKLKLDAIDDASEATKATAGIQQLLSSTATNPPIEVNCGAITVDCAAVLPTTTRAKIVTMTQASTPQFGTPKQSPYNFVVFPTEPLQVNAAAAAIKSAGGGRVGVIATSDAGGTGEAQALKAGLPAFGLKVVSTQLVATTATDLTPELQALKAAKAKTIYAHLSNPTQNVTMLNNILSLGWTTVQIVGGVPSVTQTVLTAVPSSIKKRFRALGISGVARSGPTIKGLPANEQAFIKQLKKANALDNLVAAYNGADQVNLVTWAIKKTNSTNPTKVFNALNSLGRKVKIPSGTLLQVPHPNWSSTNHSLAGADFSAYWALIQAGQPVTGTYRGTVIATSNKVNATATPSAASTTTTAP